MIFDIPHTDGMMSCDEIIDHLDNNPGNISMIFSSDKEREYFRVKLYKVKARIDGHLTDIGFFSENETKILRCKKKNQADDRMYILIITLEERKDTERFPVFIFTPPEVVADE